MKDDFRSRSHLKSIKGDRTTSRAGRRKGIDEAEQVTCHQCIADIGVETSAVIQLVQAPRRQPNGKMVGGTKVWVCAYCLGRGKTTEMVR